MATVHMDVVEDFTMDTLVSISAREMREAMAIAWSEGHMVPEDKKNPYKEDI